MFNVITGAVTVDPENDDIVHVSFGFTLGQHSHIGHARLFEDETRGLIAVGTEPRDWADQITAGLLEALPPAARAHVAHKIIDECGFAIAVENV